MQLTVETLKKMVRSIFQTGENEISCDECFDELDKFVELELAGKDAATAMPFVKAHLERCTSCREEYEALYLAIQETY